MCAGSPVDWWSAIKLPGSGGYVYADANSEEYAQSPNNVQGSTGAPVNTLTAAFKSSYALYNDETPDGGWVTAYALYCKGAVVFV